VAYGAGGTPPDFEAMLGQVYHADGAGIG